MPLKIPPKPWLGQAIPPGGSPGGFSREITSQARATRPVISGGFYGHGWGALGGEPTGIVVALKANIDHDDYLLEQNNCLKLYFLLEDKNLH
jgi:hypothetical protein